ncbi:MAG: M48 family metalloprotease [Thermodesulfobacteriota bacterium]|nr:M48 family metalloprotease [Thermodesulfobacteriota bacterium]
MPFYKKFLAIMCLAVYLAGILAAPSVHALTLGEEEDLGKEFFKYVQHRYRFVEDSFVRHYIEALGKRLAAAFPDQPFHYHFFVIEDETYNAFAAPAGYVFVNTGLIKAMNSEAELAGILTHEIAHVYCRHISEKIEKSKKIGLATLAGIAAGIFLGAGGAVPGDAVMIGSTAAGQAAALAYSRADERQADQIGVTYLCEAGYSARGLMEILQKIKSKQWFSDKEFPTYLSTHPGTDERLMYIDTLMNSPEFARCGKNSAADEAAFAVIKTKIEALCPGDNAAIRHFTALVEQNPADPSARYGLGLAFLQNNRPADAIAHLEKVAEKSPFHPHALTALGKAFYFTGAYEKALSILERVPPTDFYNTERYFYTAMAAEKLGLHDKSITLYKRIIQQEPRYLPALYELGKIAGEQGNLEDAHFYLGIYHNNRQEVDTALFHLNKALELNKDEKRKEQIEKMLADIQAFLKEQRRSMR